MGKRISIILLESSLELVPRHLWDKPSIRASARRKRRHPSKMLLDKSIHRPDMARARLPNAWKRGRPDIVHRTLLAVLGSPLNLDGGIEAIYMHTVEDRVFQIDVKTRLPKNYNQFVGLMEQLLVSKRVPPTGEKKLIWELDTSLKELVESHRPFIILENYETCRPVKSDIEGRLYGIGAFPAGRLDPRILELADNCLSLGPYTLDASTTASHLTCLLWSKQIR
ncbi:MAG: 16S rRNA methyltransferase [Desulfurococcales archaeon]|nr:16S rRNA methyltransferase [Desulfurococcales archaeon]